MEQWHQAHSIDVLVGGHRDADDVEDCSVEVYPADGDLARATRLRDDSRCLDVVWYSKTSLPLPSLSTYVLAKYREH